MDWIKERKGPFKSGGEGWAVKMDGGGVQPYDFDKLVVFDHSRLKLAPGKEQAAELIADYLKIIFPEIMGNEEVKAWGTKRYLNYYIEKFYVMLYELILKSLLCKDNETMDQRQSDMKDEADRIAAELVNELSAVKKRIYQDVQAAYQGDPAAKNICEIVLSYPFVLSVTVHQIAHFLYLKEVPILPRMLSEWSHSQTAIDIHPGAEIGTGFFIDHGTGVVIGETTVIGNNVKIYQGVTLGAYSLQKEDNGIIIKGLKRHPTIRDNVIIYANAIILGGETVIGENAVIGGNTWITESIEANTIVTIEKP